MWCGIGIFMYVVCDCMICTFIYQSLGGIFGRLSRQPTQDNNQNGVLNWIFYSKMLNWVCNVNFLLKHKYQHSIEKNNKILGLYRTKITKFRMISKTTQFMNQENVPHSSDKGKSTNSNPHMTQMVELTSEDYNGAVVTRII